MKSQSDCSSTSLVARDEATSNRPAEKWAAAIAASIPGRCGSRGLRRTARSRWSMAKLTDKASDPDLAEMKRYGQVGGLHSLNPCSSTERRSSGNRRTCSRLRYHCLRVQRRPCCRIQWPAWQADRRPTFGGLVVRPTVQLAPSIAPCGHSVGGRVATLVELDRLVEHANRLLDVLLAGFMKTGHCPQVIVVSVEALGRLARRPIDLAFSSLGAIAPTTFCVMSSWRSKMFSIAPSKRSAQRCAPVEASINCAVTRTRPGILRTLPSSTYRMPSSRPTRLRIRTPLTRWMPAHSALGSVQRTRIALPRARKLSLPVDSALFSRPVGFHGGSGSLGRHGLFPATDRRRFRPVGDPHSFRKLRQINPGTHNLLFKIPALGEDLRLAIYIKLPEGTQDVASKDERSPDGRPGNSALDAPVHAAHSYIAMVTTLPESSLE